MLLNVQITALQIVPVQHHPLVRNNYERNILQEFFGAPVPKVFIVKVCGICLSEFLLEFTYCHSIETRLQDGLDILLP